MTTSARCALLLALAASACAVDVLKLPPYIKACSIHDPNLSDCALKSGKAALPFILKGDKAYRVPPHDPLSISQVKIDDPAQGLEGGLHLILNDLKIYGLSHAVLESAKFDPKAKKFGWTLKVPQLALVSSYDMKGKMLMLPIQGNGDSSINMTDVIVKHEFDYELLKRGNGKHYIKVVDNKLTTTPAGMQIRMENLFNGDKLLGETTNTFLNENWHLMEKDFGPSLSDAIGQATHQLMSGVMENVPFEEILPEKV
ncbi:circadian clock-controlled protein daywake-like [Bacillus rossius redtenbacheri]|uniref:circadian clock-controlled protein daywake-like n=1 Tax=Bacillus rossius redtenbacheri TaxID=93214 RepID=UPI002FDEBF50